MRNLKTAWKAEETVHETEKRPIMVMYYKGKIHAIDQLIEVLGEGV